MALLLRFTKAPWMRLAPWDRVVYPGMLRSLLSERARYP